MCFSLCARARSAYIMFTQVFRKEREERARVTGQRVSPQELMALAASKWKTMSAQEREPFVAQSIAERADVEAKYRAWKQANPDVVTGYNKGGQKKIVGPPKRSAYFIFLDALREFEGEGLSETEILTNGAICWESMQPNERKPFVDEAKRERDEYRALNPSSRRAKKQQKLAGKEEMELVPPAMKQVPRALSFSTPVESPTDDKNNVAKTETKSEIDEALRWFTEVVENNENGALFDAMDCGDEDDHIFGIGVDDVYIKGDGELL